MPAPKKDKETFRRAVDAAWDLALDAQNRLDESSPPGEVATVAQAWASIAVATKAVLR